jgi:hypothetical protein
LSNLTKIIFNSKRKFKVLIEDSKFKIFFLNQLFLI